MQGKNINGFILQRLLGTGGMAEVWYAENEIGMKAAVKIMSEKLSHDEQMQDRFLNEAKVMVKLDHPNIRKVYGYGSIDNRPAIIMEYLDGSDLKARMKRGQHFSQEELKRWWNQIVDALNYTHSQDIVHRDIKPSNIFVDQKGNAKLLDFGIAKVADTSSGTLTGSTLGTRIYMSPEQVKDPKRVGTASDLYSLAVSFVHLLTGKAPYDSTTSSDYDIQESIVRKPLDLSKVPTEWRGFLEPYLSKNPADRPALRAYDAVSGASQNSVPDDYDDDSTAADAPPLSTDEDTFAEVSKSDAPLIKYGDETPSIPDNIIKPHTTRKKIVFLSILIPVIALLLVGVGTISYSYYWNHYNLGHLQRKEKDLQEQLDKKREELETLDPNKDHPAFIKYYEQCKKECDEIVEELKEVQWRISRFPQKLEPKIPDAFRTNPDNTGSSEYNKPAVDEEPNTNSNWDNTIEANLSSRQTTLGTGKSEAEKDAIAELEAYEKCNSVEACDKYLKNYPKGRYVEKVKAWKAELERRSKAKEEKAEDAAYANCTTVEACNYYLETYPMGRYVADVKARKNAYLEKEKTVTVKRENNDSEYKTIIVEEDPEILKLKNQYESVKTAINRLSVAKAKDVCYDLNMNLPYTANYKNELLREAANAYNGKDKTKLDEIDKAIKRNN